MLGQPISTARHNAEAVTGVELKLMSVRLAADCCTAVLHALLTRISVHILCYLRAATAGFCRALVRASRHNLCKKGVSVYSKTVSSNTGNGGNL